MTSSKQKLIFAIDVSGDEASMSRVIDDAVACGFDGVELVAHSAEQTGDMALITSDIDAGVPVANVNAICVHITSIEIEPAIEELASWRTVASNCAASCINLTLPPLRSVENTRGFHSYGDAINFAYELLRSGRRSAEQSGISLALTGARGRCFLSPVELRETIDAINSWAVGLCVDIDAVGQIGRPDDWLAILGRRVISVRSCFDGTSRHETYAEMLRTAAAALDTIGFTGMVIAAGDGGPRRILSELSQQGFRNCT